MKLTINQKEIIIDGNITSTKDLEKIMFILQSNNNNNNNNNIYTIKCINNILLTSTILMFLEKNHQNYIVQTNSELFIKLLKELNSKINFQKF